jgi:peptidoglycan/xylan/chitin deacetylase (PgdA/CDA1 family)
MMRFRRSGDALLPVILFSLLLGGCPRQEPEPPAQATMPPEATAPKEPEPRNIPILCMHDVGPDAKNEYSIKTADLEKYVGWLNAQGYQSVLLRDVAAYLRGEAELPEKPVVFTFDDNWKSALKIVQPLLARHGYTGVAFCISSSVGANDRRLTWEDCKALAPAGWEIGSHSKTHENLTLVPKGQSPESIRAMVEEQIRDSKAEIETNTGLEVTSFAMPYGNYDTFVLDALEEAGYTAAVSVDRATADERSDPLRLPRRMIMNNTAFSTFQHVCQAKTLHLQDMSPPPGTRVDGEAVTITATLGDADVSAPPTGEAMGEPLKVTYDPARRKLTLQAELQRGANDIALRAANRETNWLLISNG